MPDKIEAATKTGRSDAKIRKRETEQTAPEREAALVMAATQFKALGDPTRLRIINFLSSIEPAQFSDSAPGAAESDSGRTVGDVSAGVFGKAKISSTLSHHLKELRNAGLIGMKRRGKNLICRLQPDAIDELRCYLPQPVVIPVAMKAELSSLESDIEVPEPDERPAERIAAASPSRVRKITVRKKKRAEGRAQSESENGADDATAI